MEKAAAKRASAHRSDPAPGAEPEKGPAPLAQVRLAKVPAQEATSTRPAPERQARTAAEPAAAAAERPQAAKAPGKKARPAAGRAGAQLDDLLREAVAAGASDIHIHGGAPIKLRGCGKIYDHGSAPLSEDEARALVYQSLGEADRAAFEEHGEHDYCHEIEGVGRFRANAYRQLRGTDAVFRHIPAQPPSLEELGLPSSLAKLTSYHQGLVLLTGPMSCGKSSTMAALVNLVNEERADHIITIEDPIEYVHTSKRCVVNQRSVKRHTESFARALRASLREDPDVIVIGELRDRETIGLALTAAETGHLVLASLHTGSAIRTVNRVIGAFPPEQQEQVRAMLSESLRAVVSQRLLPRMDEQGVVPALEIMMVNFAVSSLIRDSKTVQIHSVLQTGAAQGQSLLDDALAELVKSRTVSSEDALLHCEDPKKIPQYRSRETV
ncbi:MAG: PilT/PilU family type 4a pilus ATPase [Deltaproteobacteria bacterium]|nr:PilT/PilU family type 4a pilus ATPase [Deltaproteobacteria bacterium]MBW2413328.1 PilT/PilU family type 4a pilus ATPase [Deltaproteobacteria bacterium]